MSYLILNIAGRALAAQQLALEVTGNNLANATTPGYHRETAQLTEGPSIPGQPAGALGEGVTVATVSRATNTFLSHALRNQSSEVGYWTALNQGLSQIQPLFSEPAPGGLEEAFNQFFASYNALSQSPASGSAQTAVIQQAKILASSLNNRANQVENTINQYGQMISGDLNTVNGITASLAQLNRQINAVIAAGQSPNDLENQRGALLDQLAQRANIRYTINPKNGETSVYIGSSAVVVGTDAYPVASMSAGGNSYASNASTGIVLTTQDVTSGSIGGSVNAISSLQGYMGQLNQLAVQLASTVNANPGATPVRFVANGSAMTAADITTADNLSTTSPTPASPYQGQNAQILALYQTLTGLSSSGSTSPTLIANYTKLVDQVGIDGQNAAGRLQASTSTQSAMNNSLQSQVGVDVNQESAQLISEQQSYTAAVKLIGMEQATMNSLMQAVS